MEDQRRVADALQRNDSLSSDEYDDSDDSDDHASNSTPTLIPQQRPKFSLNLDALKTTPVSSEAPTKDPHTPEEKVVASLLDINSLALNSGPADALESDTPAPYQTRVPLKTHHQRASSTLDDVSMRVPDASNALHRLEAVTLDEASMHHLKPRAASYPRGQLLSQASQKRLTMGAPQSIVAAIAPHAPGMKALQMSHPAHTSCTLSNVLATLEPTPSMPLIPPHSVAYPVAALSMSRTIMELAERCFDPTPQLMRLAKPVRSNELSGLQEWRKHTRWYAHIVLQNSSEEASAAALLRLSNPQNVSAPHTVQCLARSSPDDSLGAQGSSFTRLASSMRLAPANNGPDAFSAERCKRLLTELRDADLELQRVHPCFLPATAPMTAKQISLLLEKLRHVRSVATAINLELLCSFELHEAARCRLPRRASTLLPCELVSELRQLAAGGNDRPRDLSRTVSRLVRAFEVAAASPHAALSLLERLQVASEVWKLKAARFGFARPCGGSINGSNNSGDHGRLVSSGRRAHPLARVLGFEPKHAAAARYASLSAAARCVAMEVRKQRPQLPQTSFELSKIGANSQVPLAMLEAYSRAIAAHTLPAMALYSYIASAGPSLLEPSGATSEAIAKSPPAAAAATSPMVRPPEACSSAMLSPATRSPVPAASPLSAIPSAEERRYKWVVQRDEIETIVRVGAGAFGEVYVGRWRRNDVAVKFLMRSSDQGKTDFFHEMQLLSELRHPNVVRFLGACLDEQRMAILFELCPCSLYDVLHKRPDEAPGHLETLRIMRQVALGLFYLHSCRPVILHLDLKSANVLLDEVGTAKLCDFGMSYVKEEAAANDIQRSGMGSPQWSAPEVLRGEAHNERADSYSFGILLFETLSRRLPYKGHDTCEILVGVITKLLERPDLTREEAARWPPSLVSLMRRCMSESPVARPSMPEIHDLLEQLAPPDRSVAEHLSQSFTSYRATATPLYNPEMRKPAAAPPPPLEEQQRPPSPEAAPLNSLSASGPSTTMTEQSATLFNITTDPNRLRVSVHASRSGGVLLFDILGTLEGTHWMITRSEKEVRDLHSAMCEARLFMPDSPFERRRLAFLSPRTTDAELAARVRAYLEILVRNRQWLTPESSKLRDFLEVPNVRADCVTFQRVFNSQGEKTPSPPPPTLPLPPQASSPFQPIAPSLPSSGPSPSPPLSHESFDYKFEGLRTHPTHSDDMKRTRRRSRAARYFFGLPGGSARTRKLERAASDRLAKALHTALSASAA